jgi:hypothetical protein
MAPFGRLAGLAVAACFLAAPFVRAELETFCTVVRGNIVEIEVHYEDQTPAKGLKVALVDAQKKVIAAGKINADGEWSWPAPGPGAYELVLDPGTGDMDIKRYPIEVRPVALPSPEPDPDRARCDHCPAPPPGAAEETPESLAFPWIASGILLALLAAYRIIGWFGKSWTYP